MPNAIDGLKPAGLWKYCAELSKIPRPSKHEAQAAAFVVKTAKQLGLGPDEAVVTIATDGAAMYLTEVEKVLARGYPAGFGAPEAAEAYGRYVLGAGSDDLLELTPAERERKPSTFISLMTPSSALRQARAAWLNLSSAMIGSRSTQPISYTHGNY